MTKAQLKHFIKAREQLLGRRGLRRRPIRWFEPDHIARDYRAHLLRLVRRMQATLRELIPELERLVRVAQQNQPRADGPPPPPPFEGGPLKPEGLEVQIEQIGERIRDIFRPNEIRAIARRMAEGVAGFNRMQFKRVVKSVVGVDVITAEPWLADALAAAAAENVKLIVNIGEKAETEVEGLASRALRGGSRWEALAADIEDRLGVAESRAKLIARDQVSKLNGDLTRLRQQSIGVTEYRWRTSQDERVRPEHAAREGQIYRWDDPPDDGHPGEAINCRCTAEMVLPEDLID